MTTLPLPPETRKPISVSDREAQKAERDELLRVAATLMSGRMARFGNIPDTDEMVDLAQMLIASVNARFGEDSVVRGAR